MTRAIGWLAMILLLTVLSAIALPKFYATVFDRVIHHSHIFMLGGESYRLRQKTLG